MGWDSEQLWQFGLVLIKWIFILEQSKKIREDFLFFGITVKGRGVLAR